MTLPIILAVLEEGIRKRIVGTIFECTEHHKTIATFRSRRTFFRHTVLDTLYKTCSVHSKIVPTIRSRIPSSSITAQSLVERLVVRDSDYHNYNTSWLHSLLCSQLILQAIKNCTVRRPRNEASCVIRSI